MYETVTDLRAPRDLDQLLVEAGHAPVLIYKHSLTCGTSGMALEEIRALVPRLPTGVRIAMVKVQPARAVSNLIAEQFGVRHESPQILLLAGGRVLWHASHFRVTAEEILAALERFGAAASTPGEPPAPGSGAATV